MPEKNVLFVIVILSLAVAPRAVFAQDVPPPTSQKDEEHAPEKVDIEPIADDEQIEKRLTGILTSTGWFKNPEVEVNDGVVFLRGEAGNSNQKTWAGNLARKTQDVAAVVNQLQISEPDIWDYEPAINSIRNLWKNILRALPTLLFAVLILIIFWAISILFSKAFRRHLKKRETNPLLQDIIAKTVAVVVFLFGIYIVFYIADLTRVALTVLGGTGLLGIILGIAFRDITENFLASIFLSAQHPFQTGDLVEITGHTGFIQRLTIRATLLITLDGNHMQIPNSTVYKSNIINFTSNPNQRNQFVVIIGYGDSTSEAQEIGAQILENHPAVLKEPKPLVLVDELASAGLKLRFYFWVDGSKHNTLKVNSSVLRLVKTAFQEAGISMPDGAMEVIFPAGVSVDVNKGGEGKELSSPKKEQNRNAKKPEEVVTKAEGGLQSDADEIKEQARNARIPEEGADLLKPDNPSRRNA